MFRYSVTAVYPTAALAFSFDGAWRRVQSDRGNCLGRRCPTFDTCFFYNARREMEQALESFETMVTRHTMIHEQMHNFFRGFRRDAHPMATMVGVVGAMSAFYHDSLDINDPRHREVAAFRLVAKMPTIAAMAYKYSVGQPFIYPRNDLDYAANFLYMLNGVPAEPYVNNPILSRAMDRFDLAAHAPPREVFARAQEVLDEEEIARLPGADVARVASGNPVAR